MAIVNEIKCARCDRKYSGVRSRCPYCGARRIGQGKYSENSDNAKGKMMISVLIMAIFTVAAGILLFTTPIDAVEADPADDPEITSPEDDIVSLPVHEPEPSPEPEPQEPALPLEVSSIQIWVPNSHRVEDFTRSISREGAIELSARIEPPGIDVEVTWETDRPDVIEWTFVVGGIRVVPLAEGDAWLTVTAGDKEERCIIRVRP